MEFKVALSNLLSYISNIEILYLNFEVSKDTYLYEDCVPYADLKSSSFCWHLNGIYCAKTSLNNQAKDS